MFLSVSLSYRAYYLHQQSKALQIITWLLPLPSFSSYCFYEAIWVGPFCSGLCQQMA